jgi:PKD repeat protein
MKHFAALSLLLMAFAFGASAQCTPDASLTTPGFYPSPDSLPCVERGVAFDTVIQFRNFSTVNAADFGIPFPITVTVNWVRIDSIGGLPTGITYACNPSNCQIPGGSNGCINFTGTTNAATGNYDLIVYATINADVPGFGTIEEQGTSDDLGFPIFLTVINAGDPCPLPSVEVVGGPFFSCPGQSAQLNLDIDTGGAVAPFTFAWSPASGLSDATVANPTATVTSSTTYTVTVTDANGYEFTTSTTVDVDNTPTPVANFNFDVVGSEVTFTDLSSNGTNVTWQFGDGSTSTAANPTFTYGATGNYDVTLIVSNNCGSDTIVKPLTITGIANILGKELSINVFPNPTKGIFTVSLSGIAAQATQVMVFDMQGRLVKDATLQSTGGTMSAEIDLASNGNGVYFVKLVSGSQTSTHKLIVH